MLLFVSALAPIANPGKMLWERVSHWTIAAEMRGLDQLLVVLMLVEILHTWGVLVDGGGVLGELRVAWRHPWLPQPFLIDKT